MIHIKKLWTNPCAGGRAERRFGRHQLAGKRAARSRFAWYNRGARDSHCDCARPGITAAGNL